MNKFKVVKKLQNINTKGLYWIFVLFAVYFKYSYFGVKYFPALDDNNIYGVFSRIPIDKFINEITYSSFFKIRPIATILDLALWSRFWGKLWIVLIIITFMHFLSCYFIYGVFEKNDSHLGNLAVIFYIFMPLQFQATYWLSASTEVIPGIFFATLSFYLLMIYIESLQYTKSGKIPCLIGFFITNLLSIGFYEQITAFSVVFAIYLIFINKNRIAVISKHLRLCLYLFPLAGLSVVSLFYVVNSKHSNVAVRGTVYRGDYFIHVLQVLANFCTRLTGDLYLFLRYQIMDGLSYIIKDRAIIFFIFIIFIAIAFAFLTGREQRIIGPRSNSSRLILGILAILISLAPFYLINDIDIYNRNLFVSIMAFGFILDSVINYIPQELTRRIVKASAAFVLCVIFLLGSVCELYNYKLISDTDSQIVSEYIKVSQIIKSPKGIGKAIIFNVQKNYSGSNTLTIWNCTSSDWALLGALEASDTKLDLYPELAVMNGSIFNIPKTELINEYYLGIDNPRSIFILHGKWVSGKIMVLYKPDNTTFGMIKNISNGEYVFNLSEHKEGIPKYY